jgi:hypothetical protein
VKAPPGDDERRLLLQHVDVLFETDGQGRLIRLNEPGDEPPPRIFLARGRRWHDLRCSLDVPDQTAARCREIAARLPPWDGEPSDRSAFDAFRDVLAHDAAVGTESIGPAFRFGERVEVSVGWDPAIIDERSAHLLERHFPYTRSILAARSPVAGVIIDGWIVAACFSARTMPTASEAGVATEEPYRGRGLAPLVVSVWRDAVERTGRQPLYSTEWDNAPSRAVARKLRLVAYAETLSLQ